jgi:hypothetical protein
MRFPTFEAILVELGLKAKGEMIMRFLIVFAAICFSVNAFAQDTPPKAGTSR